MKYFRFTSWQDVDAFEWLMRDHRESIKAMMLQALSHAAEAITDPGLAMPEIDLLSDDDQRVWERLGKSLREFVHNKLRELHPTICEGADLFSDMLVQEVRNSINYSCIAKAIYFGVEPGDPTQGPPRPTDDDE